MINTYLYIGILADEMGMGKTIQILALIMYIKTTSSKQSLIKFNSNSIDSILINEQSINTIHINEDSNSSNEFSDLKEYISNKEKIKNQITSYDDDFDDYSYRDGIEIENNTMNDMHQDFPCVCGRKTLLDGDIDWVRIFIILT